MAARLEVLDVRDSLFLVDEQVVDNVEVLGVPTRFIPTAKPDRILAGLGLDGEGIAATVRGLLS